METSYATPAVRERILKENRCLHNIFRSRYITANTKIYKTALRPVVTFDICLVTCTLTVKLEQEPEIFERKVLRRINDNGQWRKLYNHEIKQVYQSPTITEYLRPKKIQNPAGKRKRWIHPTGSRFFGRPMIDRFEEPIFILNCGSLQIFVKFKVAKLLLWDFVWTSLLCKVFFSRQIFLLYFVKGKFCGKKFTLQKSESTLQRRFCHFVSNC
jgi:hypothetical protein